ncbi:hypothetical protein [Barnesiella intestinihominis]|jgi:hypothetical protein|uniref:hypothetical protein n=1 Tax=Barnesiella intestinihominis TaxID=487174 RepID=UPI00241C36FD|nr:hypothetical protein [Barnesiella intestinihominis]
MICIYDMNFGAKGRAFTDFLQSVSSGIIYGDKRKKLVLSDINTQCIVEYTHILLDKIHFRGNYTLGFQLDYPSGYYLRNKTYPQIRMECLFPYIVPEESPEFVWQMYLLTNADKILHGINDYVSSYCELLWMYSDEYLNTFKWEPNINEFLDPKLVLHGTYAKVECCWIESNEMGLYKDICEYDIRDETIEEKSHTIQLLLPPWGSDDYYQAVLDKLLPF